MSITTHCHAFAVGAASTLHPAYTTAHTRVHTTTNKTNGLGLLIGIQRAAADDKQGKRLFTTTKAHNAKQPTKTDCIKGACTNCCRRFLCRR